MGHDVPLRSFHLPIKESMNERLQTVLYRHEKELEQWYENIIHHQQQFIFPYDPDWEDIRKEPMDIEILLHRLLEIFIGYGAKKSTWQWHETLDYGTGLRTGVISQQIDHAYFLGVDKDGVYLESPIACPQSIHKSFDRFVQTIADYSRFGVFNYQQSEVFDDSIVRAHRGLLKKKIRGELPDLLRNYFIAKAELDGDFDFGFLEVRWPLNRFSMHQVLTEGCRAFETIHNLNVKLCKERKSQKQKNV
jgi:hypothetical protein